MFLSNKATAQRAVLPQATGRINDEDLESEDQR
jgi:hypothetical protein